MTHRLRDHWRSRARENTLIGPANLYAWKERDAVGDVLCCVQGQRRTGNPFHKLLKGQTGEGKMQPGLCW